MKVLYDWLKEFAAITAPPADLRARFSTSGTSIDALEETPAGPMFDAEVSANRPDCLAHFGLAREAAALYRLALKRPQPECTETSDPVSEAVRVEIEAPELCSRYTARIIRGLRPQPSPDWLRRRLEALGHASINNVVDVTNYVMLELGHPMHAYDYDKLTERRIVVRRGRPGEKVRTLDGFERALTKSMCVISNGEKADGVGGVMGGAHSEISSTTRTVLLEAAWFDPVSIRHTSKALNLRTEASLRFERGADIEMPEFASRRAAELIRQLAGGEILSGVVDICPAPQPLGKIELTRQELLRVLGADVPDREIEEILAALGFAPVRVDATRGSAGSLAAVWECHQVSWRRDVARQIDLIEEVARIYGYDKFPPRIPMSKQAAARLPHAAAEDRLRQRLLGLGYQEIVSIPLVDKDCDAFFRTEQSAPAIIANPLSEEASAMRGSGVVSMLAALEWNLHRGQHNLRLFEIGKRYGLRDVKPVETGVLTLGATGFSREKTVHEPGREFSFADLKGDLDRIGELAGGFEWSSGGPVWLSSGAAAQFSLRDPGGSLAGVAGKIGRQAAETFKLRQNVFAGEMALEPLLEGIEAARAAERYQPLPRFPAVERDFSLVLPGGTRFSQVSEAIRALGIAELQRVEAVDLFRGKNVPAGKYSLLVRVAFQSAAATLTDAQLAGFSSRIVATLEKQLGAALRSS